MAGPPGHELPKVTSGLLNVNAKATAQALNRRANRQRLGESAGAPEDTTSPGPLNDPSRPQARQPSMLHTPVPDGEMTLAELAQYATPLPPVSAVSKQATGEAQGVLDEHAQAGAEWGEDDVRGLTAAPIVTESVSGAALAGKILGMRR